ncbi:hypothetical protein C4K23_0255 [Pseudomonas chlororaphis]|nr:hypothetical protein C4K23_0255 [Pseudomonas chlororaphis]
MVLAGLSGLESIAGKNQASPPAPAGCNACRPGRMQSL